MELLLEERNSENTESILTTEDETEKINSGNRESTLSTEDLIDEIKTFVIAASDTTANYLTAMLFYMFEKP